MNAEEEQEARGKPRVRRRSAEDIVAKKLLESSEEKNSAEDIVAKKLPESSEEKTSDSRVASKSSSPRNSPGTSGDNQDPARESGSNERTLRDVQNSGREDLDTPREMI